MTIEERWTWCAIKEDREDEETHEGMETKTSMESREEKEEDPKRHRPGQAAARRVSIKESMDNLTKN